MPRRQRYAKVVEEGSAQNESQVSIYFVIRKLCCVLYAPLILSTFAEALILPVLPLYLRALDLPDGMVGAFISAQALGRIIFNVPAGSST